MIEINSQQYRMLKRIRRYKKLDTSKLSEEELEICDFLVSNNFLVASSSRAEEIANHTEYVNIVAESYAITQEGCAQIYAFASKFRKWWIPVVISLLAAIGGYREEISLLISWLRQLL